MHLKAKQHLQDLESLLFKRIVWSKPNVNQSILDYVTWKETVEENNAGVCTVQNKADLVSVPKD